MNVSLEEVRQFLAGRRTVSVMNLMQHFGWELNECAAILECLKGGNFVRLVAPVCQGQCSSCTGDDKNCTAQTLSSYSIIISLESVSYG